MKQLSIDDVELIAERNAGKETQTLDLSNERVREILRLLNEYEVRDGPNVFEDVVYGLPEYNGSATEATYPEHVYSFVLMDDTRVERSQHQTVPNGVIWTAHRVTPISDPETEGELLNYSEVGKPIYGSTNVIWQMFEDGRAIRWDGKEWKEEK